MLVFQSYRVPSRSKQFADKYFKKEEEEEARLKQEESIRRQKRMAELVKSPGDMIAQTELARLQMKERPSDLSTPVMTVQNCLLRNQGRMGDHLLALDTLLELVEKAALTDYREKTRTDLKPALDAIKAVAEGVQACKPTDPEANSALYQLSYISSRFYDSAPAGKNKEERGWLLMDVQMGDGWGSLEDFYHNRIQPVAVAKALEILAMQTSLEGKMEFLQTAFRVLIDYKGWEKKHGEDEEGYAAYRTPAYFKTYADDPFLQTLLVKMEETLQTLETARAESKNLEKAESVYQALRKEIEKFNGQSLGSGAYAGTSVNKNPTNFTQYVASKLGAGSVDELFVFRVKDSCLGALKVARAEAESQRK